MPLIVTNEPKPITLNGIFGRTLTQETLGDWKDQISRLEGNDFTHSSAERICAIAEHINCIPLNEKAEYISEILELALPAKLGYALSDIVKQYYK